MQNSLFTIELPLVNTKEELDKIKNAFPKYDPYFIASGCIKERRDKFNELWSQYEGLHDKNFLSHIKRAFHERTWEMYVGCFLKEYFPNKVSPSPRGKCRPDFILNQGEDDEMVVEAVACKRGDGLDAVPKILVEDMDKAHIAVKLRLSNSITSKAGDKYKFFIEGKNKPYIIAFNRGAFSYSDPQIDLALKFLFGSGKEFIKKPNGSKVPMKFFTDDKNNFVSAVIYSPDDILNAPLNIGSDCVLIHNQKAKIPIDVETFHFLTQYKADHFLNIKEIKPFDLSSCPQAET